MSDIEERIRLLEEHVDSLRDDLRVLRTLVEHDHASALNKIRYITEKVLHDLCTANDVSWGKKAHPTLERMLGPLVANDVIPRNVAIHVRTIQTNASPGSHYQESALTSTHVHIAQVALLDFLEWQVSERPSLVDGIPVGPAPAARSRRRRWIIIAVGSALTVAALAGLLVVWGGGEDEPEAPGTTESPAETTLDAGSLDAGPGQIAAVEDEGPTDGFRIGGDLTLTEAAMLWRTLRRSDRHAELTFLSTTPDRYAAMAPAGTSPEQAGALAATLGLEATRHEGEGRRLVPRLVHTTTSVSLRTGPDTDHPSVRILPSGSLVVVIEGTVDGTASALSGDAAFLYVVATADHSGWSASSLVETDDRCLPPPDAFLAEAPAARAEVLGRDLTYARVRILAPAGSGLGFVLLARDTELGRSHVGVFLEHGECQLQRQFFSTVDGIVEGTFVVETEDQGGETLLLTESHPSLEPGPDGRETWHAYRLTSTDPVWALDIPTFRNVRRQRRSILLTRAMRAGSVRGYWPVRIRHRAHPAGTDYYRWDGSALQLDTSVGRSAPAPE